MLNYLSLSRRKQEKGNKKEGFRKILFSFSFGISDGTANFLSFPLGKEIRMGMHCNLMISPKSHCKKGPARSRPVCLCWALDGGQPKRMANVQDSRYKWGRWGGEGCLRMT